MPMQKVLDYHRISHEINMAGVELNDSRNDGFNQFEIKKDLYRLKWLLDLTLEKSPSFIGEDQFLMENDPFHQFFGFDDQEAQRDT
jgi:hypothetical protein